MTSFFYVVSIATCQPLFKTCVSLLSTYKTIELCFEFLSHFFKVYIWLSLVDTSQLKNNESFANGSVTRV